MYCPDGFVRKVVRLECRKLSKRQNFGIFLLNPTWTAKPILSDTVRPFALDELRSLIWKQIRYHWPDGQYRRKLKDKLQSAQGFDDLFELL